MNITLSKEEVKDIIFDYLIHGRGLMLDCTEKMDISLTVTGAFIMIEDDTPQVRPKLYFPNDVDEFPDVEAAAHASHKVETLPVRFPQW